MSDVKELKPLGIWLADRLTTPYDRFYPEHSTGTDHDRCVFTDGFGIAVYGLPDRKDHEPSNIPLSWFSKLYWRQSASLDRITAAEALRRGLVTPPSVGLSKIERCNGSHADFQGALRVCTTFEGCGLFGCAFRKTP